MAEKPEDLNLPNAVIARLVKEAVCIFVIIFWLQNMAVACW